MITHINFANEKFKFAQKTNSFFAKYIGKVDKTIAYNPENIDKEFYSKNKTTLDSPRGSGLWLWKPYFINETLKNLKEGDFLIYSDSGSIFIKNVRHIINEMEQKDLNIFLSFTPFCSKEWTRKFVFEYLNINNDLYHKALQPCAGYIVIRKSKEGVNFINEWLSLCENYDLIRDSYEGEINFNDFIDHRHDQSLLGIVSKKHKLNYYRDISQYGEERFYHENFSFLKLPIVFPDFDKKLPTVIFLHRTNLLFKPILKYFIKLFLFKVNKSLFYKIIKKA